LGSEEFNPDFKKLSAVDVDCEDGCALAALLGSSSWFTAASVFWGSSENKELWSRLLRSMLAIRVGVPVLVSPQRTELRDINEIE
jgi:hypothetical protein